MAAVRSGIIPQTCAKCQSAPEMKACWGCTAPLQTAVEKLPDDFGNPLEYYSCPLLFVSARCNDFLSKMSMTEDGFSSALPYDDEEAWFIDARHYYSKWYEHFKRLLNGR